MLNYKVGSLKVHGLLGNFLNPIEWRYMYEWSFKRKKYSGNGCGQQ